MDLLRVFLYFYLLIFILESSYGRHIRKTAVKHHKNTIPAIEQKKTNKESRLLLSENEPFQNPPIKIRSKAMPVTTQATTQATTIITTPLSSEGEFQLFKHKLNFVALIDIIMVTILIIVGVFNIILWLIRMKKLKDKKDLEAQLNELKSKSDKAATTEKPDTSVSISEEK